MKKTWLLSCLLGLSALTAFWVYSHRSPSPVGHASHLNGSPAVPLDVPGATAAVDPCNLVLIPHAGEERVDREIQRLQQRVAGEGPAAMAQLERLGWAYVGKARASFDPGYYKLAEQCANCMQQRDPQGLESMLLRGHVLHNLHRFKEAEPLARELVQRRTMPADFGLLGDVLMEQGNLDEAITAYQRMVDLRPDLHSYARAAQVRWLRGDLAGAQEFMEMAVSASSPLDAESAAWVRSRLAGFQFQAGDLKEAVRTCADALVIRPDYPPALLVQGRIHLSRGEADLAVPVLETAQKLNPLPEYQWVLSEALRAAGRSDEAGKIERDLRQHGAVNDPRTYALFLATRAELIPDALRLAEAELEQRGDVFTHDALAWSLAAAGRWEEAWKEMQIALKEGTQDARLLFHATIIAARSGRQEEAQQWINEAAGIIPLLLPSELEQFTKVLEVVATRPVNNLPLSGLADSRPDVR